MIIRITAFFASSPDGEDRNFFWHPRLAAGIAYFWHPRLTVRIAIIAIIIAGAFIGIFANDNLALAEKLAHDIYVVDIQKVLQESIAGKSAKNNIEAEAKKSSLKLENLKKELDRLRLDLEKQSAVLSAGALEEKRDNLEKKERAFKRAYQDEKETITQKNAIEISKVVETIDKFLKTWSGDHGDPLILERDPRLVVYVESKWDLTNEVIRVLDSEKLKL